MASEETVERRQITFVFCDLVDSTALSDELDPEDYREIIIAYRRAVSESMTQFGGRVERYRGDGTLVYFGYPEAHEDDAERAVYAALKTLEAVGSIALPGLRRLAVRIGICTGLVVVGGVEDSEDLAAMGDAPNLSSRLQGSAEPNSIIVDESTRRLAGELFEFRDMGPLQVKGLATPMRAWRVAGAAPAAGRFEARRAPALTPMLGRDDESRILSELWQAARRGCGQIALVTGDAGIGKSRLAASLLDDARREPSEIYRYFCFPYRQASPLYPCIQQLERSAEFTVSDLGDEKLRKLEAILTGMAVDDRTLIAELLNLPAPALNSLKSLSPAAKRRRTMKALVKLLERASERNPTLVVFEDVQWIDDTSRELLLMIAALVPRMAVLLVVLMRPSTFTDLDDHAGVTHLPLAPLPASVCAALVRHIAADRPLPAGTVKDIVLRTDGIPLFLEEVTRATVGDVTRFESAVGSLEGQPLSMLLRASLQSRLNRLGSAREVLEAAAVIGRDFSMHLLELVVRPQKDLAAALDRLIDFGLVLKRGAPEPAFTFKHALIRDVAYEIIGRDARRSLHERVAQALEAHFPDVVVNQPEMLAWHYTEARVGEKAVAQWLAAGRNALRRSAMVEALKHLNRGLALIAPMERTPWRLQTELALTICVGMAQIATQGYAVKGTGTTFARARALCETLGDPPSLLAVLHGLWTHALMRADFHSAQQQATEILQRGESRDDPLWRLMGYRFSGVTCHPLGRFTDAIRHLETGLTLYDPAQQALYASMTVDDPRVVMLTYMSWSQMCTGRLGEALRNTHRAVAEARGMAHVYTLAHALTGASFVALTIISPQDGLQRLDELSTALTDSGIAYYNAVETIFRGYCLAAVGEHARALDLLGSGIPAYRNTDSVLYLSGFLRMSAEAYGWAGEIDTAMRLIEEGLAVMQSTNQRWDEAEMHRVRGVLFRAAGDEAAAMDEFRRACAVSVVQGARLWELRARCELFAARDASADSQPEAVQTLRSLVASFGDKFDGPDLRRARAILKAR
ncbi:AAA family ATPase [Paraburkholderia sp. MMS20-SJTN17]|uniref:AAA family ATPase n=1 Tax=Paraburkholderia translucens TaxID=2886945 RepID=A0ABS8K702_9BURK|nr:AAA family ATPase [Paraburkholderia sp. MMS20-SJTN17]MCC8400494.1 AAA family ATPase [Paraburkholderia sp. MMS20-SJTN17]